MGARNWRFLSGFSCTCRDPDKQTDSTGREGPSGGTVRGRASPSETRRETSSYQRRLEIPRRRPGNRFQAASLGSALVRVPGSLGGVRPIHARTHRRPEPRESARAPTGPNRPGLSGNQSDDSSRGSDIGQTVPSNLRRGPLMLSGIRLVTNVVAGRTAPTRERSGGLLRAG